MLSRNPSPFPRILPEDKKEGSWMLPDSVDKIQEKLGGTLKKTAGKQSKDDRKKPRQ
jgi:hypothetical protein